MASELRASFAALLLGAAVLGWSVACEHAAPAGPPARLADTGLYADFAARTLAADVLPYTPQYPLWTDGATKRRWIRLPPGSAIDARDPDLWSFPAGTKLWKEFSFGERVETRLLERRRDGSWSFAAYLWSPDGTDAVLAPEQGVPGACETDLGTRHDVPARRDCRACHEAGPNVVLGFSALQLSSARDPLAPHAESPEPGAVDLAELVRRGLLRGLPPELEREPPRIAARTPRERAALGYLHANCGSCHAGGGALASLGLALDYRLGEPASSLAPALRTTLGVASRSAAPGAAGIGVRIAPGAPEESLVVQRMRSRDSFAQMPPLGTHAADLEALALVRDWIREELGRTAAASTVRLDRDHATLAQMETLR